MAYTIPVTQIIGGLITASDWNTYIRDNWLSLSGLIGYRANASPLSGWSEFTGARGFLIVGLVSGGELWTSGGNGTVGTALTNKQNIAHSHAVPYNGWTSAAGDFGGNEIVLGDPGVPPNFTKRSSADRTSGTAAAGSSGTPYIQLLCIQKD